MVPAPQRGLGASPGRGRGAARRGRGRAQGRGGRGAAPGRGRLALCVRLALSRRRHGARAGACSSTAIFVTQSGGAEVARGRLGAVGGDARPARGGGRGRLPRPGLLRLLGRDGLSKAPPRRRLEGSSSCRAAEAVHHEQLTNDRVAGRRRLVEFHRNRDLYMRKHHGAASAAAVRVLTAWSYAVRALVVARASGAGRRLVLAPRPACAEPRGRRDPRGGGRAQRAARPRGGRGEA